MQLFPVQSSQQQKELSCGKLKLLPMPMNWQTFRTRTLSAIVFVIIMLAGLLWSSWSFFALFSIIHFGCWIEYQRLAEKIDLRYASISLLHRYGVIAAGWGFMIWMTDDSYTISGFAVAEAGFWLMVAGAIALNVDTLIRRRGKVIAHSLIGLLYISLSLGLLVWLSQMITLPFWWMPVFLISCMWINDTMAYIVGSFIGKTPFSPISPKKTWEGTIGGVVLCVLIAGFVVAPLLLQQTTAGSGRQLHFFAIAALAAVFGTLGDLFESKLKRMAGVKDSGQMMPGHGGFLDRFDSLLLAVPVVALYVWAVIGR